MKDLWAEMARSEAHDKTFMNWFIQTKIQSRVLYCLVLLKEKASDFFNS